jgi:UDP-N-acetylmuramoyl-tripeptide--D-alanyl-D-alanine ligase
VARELANLRQARLVLVLGEMLELGKLSRPEHQRAGQQLLGSHADELIAIAGDARLLVEATQAGGSPALFCDDALAAAPEVLSRVRSGDVVLVMASRGVGAEKVVEELIRTRGRAA